MCMYILKYHRTYGTRFSRDCICAFNSPIPSICGLWTWTRTKKSVIIQQLVRTLCRPTACWRTGAAGTPPGQGYMAKPGVTVLARAARTALGTRHLHGDGTGPRPGWDVQWVVQAQQGSCLRRVELWWTWRLVASDWAEMGSWAVASRCGEYPEKIGRGSQVS